MHKIIRDLYMGDIHPIENTYDKTEELAEARKKYDAVYQKIIHALKQTYGEEKASDIENEWFSVGASVDNEEMVSVFRDALYIGFDLGVALTKR
ncbi:MAG: hypothetical protein K2P09_05115 [Erysipelotrichales bacterium]|nr:hypothetical protein [Erysipelotrichales bacterium]